ncbi:hypothetical protein HanXRQr2_Chr12g0524761 [Helianthus annuus]|uniref:Uncharacterized protein n=1 Tax=Helianthus annuus TaxID=4232 RepID=A0A9K3ENV4_HELAN|nr:hypothetical protein HanXRQr2_Chr12g0524761 [Helianthus annuus]KAJ0861342.1 hypothetical protein HanPSC8_Chr12g0505611 [Helianthus annuus]
MVFGCYVSYLKTCVLVNMVYHLRQMYQTSLIMYNLNHFGCNYEGCFKKFKMRAKFCRY